MRKVFIVSILIVFLVSACATLKPHPRAWTPEEKKCGVFLGLGIVADAYTTEKMLDNGHSELNPALGEHPDDTALAIYFPLSAFIILGLSHWYPELRKPFLLGYGGLSFGAALNNTQLD